MDSKVSSVLEKVLQDKAKGNFHKALSRINEALAKHPDEVELYLEAADVSLEGGESLQATQFLKKAFTKFSAEKDRLDNFAREKLHNLGDPVLAKFLLEHAVKRRDLDWAGELLEDLQDRTIRELLQRNRTKRQTLDSAARGGHALKSELVVNVLSEALLCLRLGRMKAAVHSLLETLDDKPVENEVLEPFFSGLEKKYAKAGRIRYAYACSLMYAQQYDKAMSRLVQGVQMEPKIADDALERLRSLAEKFETPPDSVQDALVEILLAKGDVLRAGEILRESLRNNPEKSKRVMDLMRPHVENVSDSLALHFLYMDAALLAEQTRRVLEKVKAIRRSEQHRDELYEWLEKKSAEQFLPADVMIVHGEMALEKEKFDRAVEILKAVVASSPNDANAVMTILEKHKNGNRKIAEFYDEQLEKQRSDAPQHADDGSEFEHFENKEFKFTSGAKDEIQIETEEGPGLGDKVDPARDAVKPVELDPGPFGGAGGEEEAGGLEVEDGGGLEAEDGGGLEVEDNGGLEVEDNGGLEVEDGGGLEVEDGGDLEVDNGGGFELEGGGDKRKSPLELGLERAAEAVAKDRSAEILWEEEDADGILETGTEPVNADSEEDDSWLELQGDSVMGGGGLTDSGRQDEAEEHADPQPESPPRPEVADWDEPAEPEAPSPAEDSTREDTAEETDEQPQTAEQGPAAEDAAPEEPACDIGEQHVLNLAESLSRAGARLFFYVQTESGSETAERPSQDSPSGEPKPEDVPAEAAAPQPEGQKDEPPGGDDLPAAIAEVDVEVDVPLETPIESAPDSPDSFEAQFERFLDGKLDNDAVLELAASALESGKTEEARELLHFDPENDGQRSARMRYLVEYYVALDKPSAALNLIDSIDLASLAAEDRRVILIKKASCHNIMNDFESAKAVYDEIANEFPSDEVDKLLERNNERLKRRRDGGALVLEITTSLQDD